MNFHTFRNQLNELNDFFDYIEKRFKDKGLSEIDRDTLVDYIRDLYKAALQNAPAQPIIENTAPQAPNSLSQKEATTLEKETNIQNNTQAIELDIPKTAPVKATIIPTPIVLEVIDNKNPLTTNEMPLVENENPLKPNEMTIVDNENTIIEKENKPENTVINTMAFSISLDKEEERHNTTVNENIASGKLQQPVQSEQQPCINENMTCELEIQPVQSEEQPCINENMTSQLEENPLQSDQQAFINKNMTCELEQQPRTFQEQATPIENTAFTFTIPDTTTTEEDTISPNIEEITFQTAQEIVLVPNPTVQETGMTIVNNTALTTEVNTQPQIVLNTIIDDEMFEERSMRFNPEYDDLFYVKTNNELSAKLAEKPIDDLNKSMGFNDKFLYINELFGGNAIKFKTAIEYCNNEAKNLNDARAYIERELIETFHWNSNLKSNLAKEFIKLLRRRYLKK